MGDKQQPKKCVGRFESTYMKTMKPPSSSDYAPRKRDFGQYAKILNKLEMDKKFQFPTGLPKYKYDYCGEKYPVAGEKQDKTRKPVLNYKPSCPQYAPYHSSYQDMSLHQRRLDSEPEHEHTWYRDKRPPKYYRSSPIILEMPPDPDPEEPRLPERAWSRLKAVKEEHDILDHPRTVMGPYYYRLKPVVLPKHRPRMPKEVQPNRLQLPPPPKTAPAVATVVIDKSRSSRDATTYGFNNSMLKQAGAMVPAPDKALAEKPKTGVSTFFMAGSTGLQSQNGKENAELFYRFARPYSGALYTQAAEKALASRYLSRYFL